VMDRNWWGSVAVVLALSVTARATEDDAVAALKRVGGTFDRVEDDPRQPVRAVYLPGGLVTDVDLKNLADMPRLETLKLDSAGVITDAGLKELAGLKQLKDLGLSGTRVTDAGLKHLSGLKDLRHLNLDFTRVSDAGLEHLTALKSLETLSLS